MPLEKNVDDFLEASEADETNTSEGVDQVNNSDGGNDDNLNNTEVAIENRADEVVIDAVDEDDSDDSDIEAGIVRRHQVTRPGRTSKPYDYKRNFPGTAHVHEGNQDGKWLKPYYYDDENMVEKLSSGIFL